ncbi:MAG: nucleoside monophosphate kinase [Verrucomicrobiota bacterium]|jgi:adenylate kinase|nr:nucleoside monophosphate kinase [Verrucomicrobiota bacterium]MDP6251500.1 nucleoside monophosphate kinase [Verrucomicrobiota bacterium]MDP7177581.1 nucleoside monophosphate kinase [Verrucomicrobiota bacterium]MDP7291607.1 nucleoside monophosphate kinase [Verrucomicrobiota bacterium]MDP7441787.1 nucleoside monophosphate kinase [Verrucomicrobiota bacterium]|tara:strand:+ start:424 stop:1011 length:588 start_codon:yes stop_codon:yes gene_type:complete
MKLRTILLFGSPGAGKGTQGKILGSIPSYLHISSGDLFRNLGVQNPLGQTFLEYAGRGQLVPDEPTIGLFRDDIENRTRNGTFHPETDTLLLDGIPRNPAQARLLDDTLNVVGVLNLFCTDLDIMVERLQARALRENRLDDANLETIRNRLEVYEAETRPVLDHYGDDLVHTIDSTQTPVRVLRDVLEVLAKLET